MCPLNPKKIGCEMRIIITTIFLIFSSSALAVNVGDLLAGALLTSMITADNQNNPYLVKKKPKILNKYKFPEKSEFYDYKNDQYGVAVFKTFSLGGYRFINGASLFYNEKGNLFMVSTVNYFTFKGQEFSYAQFCIDSNGPLRKRVKERYCESNPQIDTKPKLNVPPIPLLAIDFPKKSQFRTNFNQHKNSPPFLQKSVPIVYKIEMSSTFKYQGLSLKKGDVLYLDWKLDPYEVKFKTGFVYKEAKYPKGEYCFEKGEVTSAEKTFCYFNMVKNYRKFTGYKRNNGPGF